MIELRHARDAETGDAYERLYEDHGIHHQDSVYLLVLDTLRPQSGRRLLDVSCGEGQFVRHAAGRGLVAYGLDFSTAAVKRAQRTAPAARLAVADGEQLPYPDGSFDYVTCIGSLEHFTSPLRGATEIRRVLRPGGTACVLVPNTFGLMFNVLHAWRTGDLVDDGQPVQRYGTRLQWTQLLEQAGLHIVAVRKFERPLPRTFRDLVWYLARPLKLLVTLAVLPLIPTNLSHCFIFICRRDGRAGGHE